MWKHGQAMSARVWKKIIVVSWSDKEIVKNIKVFG